MKAKDLAHKLNVSPATISLVLNNKPGISDTLRSSLIEKIKDLGCEDMLVSSDIPTIKPATIPSSSRRPGIAYLIYTASEENSDRFAFYPAVLEGAEMEARDIGCNLLVLHVSCDGNPHLSTLLKDAGAIGVIIQADHISEAVLQDLSMFQLPYVFIDAYRPDERVSSVCINNEQGIYCAVRYLKDMGHHNLGYISSGKESDSSIERRRSFHQALREYGLDDNRSNYYFADGEHSGAVENLRRQWKSKSHLPSAFITENDMVAWRAMTALTKCGYRVPDDVSIIGFDDRAICTMTEPKLTSIRNFRHLMGRQAVTMIQNKLELAQKLNILDAPIKLEMPTELITRESVKKIKA
ncbi:LacI family DNA-binding transcriptional regulator [Scatolibacter rhodanostii]|uniref:LacI family DNA-binding transcriptional regulator n=1 Tax=Scatolibacter rhodanostii TaxID=2014781 RepID=UPI000C06F812|nr:LacI family DNA-binding transcriptional regulator [Scatolibacter rhodanostii]